MRARSRHLPIRDSTITILVARPDRISLVEAARTSTELRGQKMANQLLAINGVFRATDSADPLAVAFERRGTQALSQMPPELARLPRMEIALLGRNIVGLEALRMLFSSTERIDVTAPESAILPPEISGLS